MLYLGLKPGQSYIGRWLSVKYEWDKIEHEYVCGKMDMAELARKHKIPLRTFYARAEVRKFSEKREKYRNQTREKAIARAQARDARTLGNLQSALDKASRLLNRYITDEDTLFGRVLVTADGIQEYRARKMDTKAMRDMTAAMREVSAAIKLWQPETEKTDGERGGVIVLAAREDDGDA